MSVPTLTPEPARPNRDWTRRALTAAALSVTVCVAAAVTGLTPAHADATVTKTITIYNNAILRAAAFTPNGTQVYVTKTNYDAVSLIDVASGTVSKTIAVGIDPEHVVFTPDGSQAYVTNGSGSGGGSGSVSVIDVASGTVSTTIPVGDSPVGVVFSPDGSQAYVPNKGSGSVSVIDVSTGAVSTTITVGTEPRGIAFTPDGAQAYVSNSNGSVSVIAVPTATVSKAIPVSDPNTVVFSPDGTQAYVPNITQGTVSVIAVATGTVSKTVQVGESPSAVTFSPDGIQAYVPNVTDGTVSVIATGLAAYRAGSKHVTVDGPATVNPAPNAAFLITGSAPANATVTVHFHKAGTAAADYGIARSVTARADGTWSRSIAASSDYRYYATVPSGTSATVLFQPAPTLTGPVSRVVPANQRHTLTGTALAGSTVFLHFHRRGTAATDYSIVRSVTAASDGTWQRSYLADTDYRVFTSRAAGADSSDGPRYLLQAG